LFISVGSTISLKPNEVMYVKKEGDMMNDIVCQAICSPPCNYVWTSPKNKNMTGATLSLGKISRASTGVYQCTARNIMRENVMSVSLNVNCK